MLNKSGRINQEDVCMMFYSRAGKSLYGLLKTQPSQFFCPDDLRGVIEQAVKEAYDRGFVDCLEKFQMDLVFKVVECEDEIEEEKVPQHKEV